MEATSYTTKSGATQYKPLLTSDELSEAMSDGSQGFCLACGAEAYGVEPDARRYICESCSQPKVYGLEELLMMGLMEVSE